MKFLNIPQIGHDTKALTCYGLGMALISLLVAFLTVTSKINYKLSYTAFSIFGIEISHSVIIVLTALSAFAILGLTSLKNILWPAEETHFSVYIVKILLLLIVFTLWNTFIWALIVIQSIKITG